MRAPLFFALLFIVPVHGTYGQVMPSNAPFGLQWYGQSISEDLGETIRTIVEHHVMSPAPQELASYASRLLDPTITPTEIRAVWKLQSMEEIGTYLKDLEASHVQPSWRTTSHGSIEFLASRVPETHFVWGGMHLASLERTYVGLGIRLLPGPRFPVVNNPEPSGPGYAAGLRDQDAIIEINGASTENQSTGRVIKNLRDKHGTAVTLRIRRFDRKTAPIGIEEKDITITRDVINFKEHPASVKRSEENLTWCNIVFSAIHEGTFEELREIERALQDDAGEVEQIYLDLSAVRSCSAQHAILFADLLTPTPGQPLGRTVTLKGERQLRSTGNAIFADKPITLKISADNPSVLNWVQKVTPTRKANVLRTPVTTWVGTEVVPIGTTRYALRLPTTQFFAPANASETRTSAQITQEMVDLFAKKRREWTAAHQPIEAVEKRLEQPFAKQKQATPDEKNTWIVENGVVVGTKTERVENAEVREYNFTDFEQIMDLPLKERIEYYAEHIDKKGNIRLQPSPLEKAQP